MSIEINGRVVKYDKFMFVSHTVRYGGYLPQFETGAHACWYYCICAHKMIDSVKEGAAYEGENDHIEALNNLAQSIVIQYELNTPSDFLKFMSVVIEEAIRSNIEFDPSVINPWTKDYKRTMS